MTSSHVASGGGSFVRSTYSINTASSPSFLGEKVVVRFCFVVEKIMQYKHAPGFVARFDEVLVLQRLLGIAAFQVRDEVGDEQVLAKGCVAVLANGNS